MLVSLWFRWWSNRAFGLFENSYFCLISIGNISELLLVYLVCNCYIPLDCPENCYRILVGECHYKNLLREIDLEILICVTFALSIRSLGLSSLCCYTLLLSWKAITVILWSVTIKTFLCKLIFAFNNSYFCLIYRRHLRYVGLCSLPLCCFPPFSCLFWRLWCMFVFDKQVLSGINVGSNCGYNMYVNIFLLCFPLLWFSYFLTTLSLFWFSWQCLFRNRCWCSGGIYLRRAFGLIIVWSWLVMFYSQRFASFFWIFLTCMLFRMLCYQ